MAHDRKPAWHTAREFATHWLVGGVILAATGFVPEEWLARVLDGLRVPADALHLWGADVDLRLVLVGAGCAVVAGDVAWRRLARRDVPAGPAAPLLPPAAASGDPPLPDRPSIAVLPFANLSADPDQEYFSDGVADDIITELSRARDLFVIARNSSFTYKGRAVDVRQVARELGVRYVLEGSLRRDGERIRVNAQLIDAGAGSHVWAERYDRDSQHVFAVQDEITEAVVGAIVPALEHAERRRVLRTPPRNLSAWEAYQRGMWHLGKLTPADSAAAREFFEQTLAIDPGFAPAQTGIASVYLDEALNYGLRPWGEAAALAEAASRKAIALDPEDAEAWAGLAFAVVAGGDRPRAVDAGKRALALNRNSSRACVATGIALVFSGVLEEGRALLRMALRLNPRDYLNKNALSVIAGSYYFSRDYGGCVSASREALARVPDYAPTRRFLVAALAQLDQRAEAEALLRETVVVSPEMLTHFVRNRPPFVRAEDQAHLLDGLRKAGWQC